MPVEDFLLDNEKILYNSPTKIEYQNDHYEFYLTDKRLLWYKREGLLFKSDSIIAESLENILEIKYEEKGILSKRGSIQVVTSRKTLDFSSSIPTIRAIYQQLQSHSFPSDTSSTSTCDECGKKIITNEAKYCPHCGFKLPI